MFSPCPAVLDVTCQRGLVGSANYTSSSAVAERPRDASCLSVVGFNSTKRIAQSFIVSYISYRFITACN